MKENKENIISFIFGGDENVLRAKEHAYKLLEELNRQAVLISPSLVIDVKKTIKVKMDKYMIKNMLQITIKTI